MVIGFLIDGEDAFWKCGGKVVMSLLWPLSSRRQRASADLHLLYSQYEGKDPVRFQRSPLQSGCHPSLLSLKSAIPTHLMGARTLMTPSILGRQ